jgi:hypothetical protein
MRSILYAPDEIGAAFTLQSGGVCQTGDALSDHDRVAIVVLELDPRRLSWELAQLLHKTCKIMGWRRKRRHQADR